MRQQLTTDTAERYIEATPESLYAIVSDVTRTPEMSSEGPANPTCAPE